jgi:LacI family sucrose operon transcriptional repressor
MMANIKDVAKRAGVSVTTVSRVINNSGYIGKDTRHKVETAMTELDYIPNQIARSLQKQQSYILGVIVPDSNHPFFSDLIKYIEVYASVKNYKILICNSLNQSEKEIKYISMLRENQVDGIIMCSHTMDVDAFERVKLPIVSFDRILSGSIPYVSSDNFHGGQLAAEHLINKGCTRLLHLSGSLELDLLPNLRWQGFQSICKKHQVSCRIVQKGHHTLSYKDYEEFVDKDVSTYLSEIDGIFCNDTVAYAIYIYAIKHGIKVPEDLKIIGYDYHSFTKMIQIPKLTTIRQPIDQIAQELFSKVIQLIHRKEKEQELIEHTKVGVDLVVGTTT